MMKMTIWICEHFNGPIAMDYDERVCGEVRNLLWMRKSQGEVFEGEYSTFHLDHL
jgi:hypothetical protein